MRLPAHLPDTAPCEPAAPASGLTAALPKTDAVCAAVWSLLGSRAAAALQSWLLVESARHALLLQSADACWWLATTLLYRVGIIVAAAVFSAGMLWFTASVLGVS